MSCKSILPTNLDENINALDVLGCRNLKDINASIKKIKDFNNPLEIDEEFLNLLIDEYEADSFVDFEKDTRGLILFAQKKYPKLGTVGAVREVFKALGIEAEIVEWFDSGKKPFTFDLKLVPPDNCILNIDFFKNLRKKVDFVKNARSTLDAIKIEQEYKDPIKTSTAIGFDIELNKELKTDFKITDEIYHNCRGYVELRLENVQTNMEFIENTNITGGGVYELRLENVQTNMEFINKTKTVGVAIWQV